MNVNIPRQAGQIVRQCRNEKGWTQVQLAKEAGVSDRLIVSLELGDATGIRLDKLLSILQALDLEMRIDINTSSDSSSIGDAEKVVQNATPVSSFDDPVYVAAKEEEYAAAFALLQEEIRQNETFLL